MKLDCWEGKMGQRLKVESMSRVAASVLGGASRMMALTSLKMPQLQVNKSGSIPSLIEERKGSFLGNERSWMTLCSVKELTFRMVPRGKVQKGLIKNSSHERENGLV